jgi:hypothetical protein
VTQEIVQSHSIIPSWELQLRSDFRFANVIPHFDAAPLIREAILCGGCSDGSAVDGNSAQH